MFSFFALKYFAFPMEAPLSEQQLWNQIKKTLQENLRGKLLHSVLNTVTLESFTSQGQKHFTLSVPSSFHQQILKTHLPNIQTQIKTQGIPYKTIVIKKSTVIPPAPKKNIFSLPPKAHHKKNSSFFSQWTFSSFIQGPSNRFAFSLAQSVATQPLKNSSNPLFIYGPSGMGKTHLLHAIGNTLEERKPHLKVYYLSAERFLNDCISHIRKNQMPAFRQKYRKNLHVLLLDDIQILGRGESTQEEFFHTFESLKQENCQIVLVSDQKPKNIKGLKERIKTRFEGGVVASVQIPDKDTRTAIIRSKAQTLHLNISEEVLHHIGNIPSRSVREIEGHLNKLKMFCELQNKKLSLSLVQELFSKEELVSVPNNLSCSSFPPASSLSLENIKTLQKEVCSRFQLKLSDLKSKSRLKHLVQARNIAIYIARKELKLPLTEIGRFFGNRHHSTILNCLKSIEKQQKKDRSLVKNLHELVNIIHKKRI